MRLWEKMAKQALSAYYNDGPDQSLTLYGIVLNVAERLKDQRLIAITHYRIGRTYSGLGQIREAIQSHLTSKKFFESAGLRRDLIYVLGDQAALYYQAEEYKTAKSYAEESVALAEKVKGGNEPRGVWPDEYGVAGALSILGALSRQEGDYDQAIEHLQKSIALYQHLNGETLKFGFYLADNLTELGRVYSAMGDNVQAFSCLNRALDVAKKTPTARYAGECAQQRRRPISGAGGLRKSERSPTSKFADLSGTQKSDRIGQSPAQSRRDRPAAR